MIENTQKVEKNLDAENNQIWGILAYICAIIPLIAAPKDSEFSRFHTNQGLILMITSIAVHIIFLVLFGIDSFISVGIFDYMFYIVFAILSLARGIFVLGIIGLMVLGILNVTKKQMVELPIIGKYRILK